MSRSIRVDPVAQKLIAQFKLSIPKNEEIVRSALQSTLLEYKGDVARVKANVSKIVTDAEARAYAMYKYAQWPVIGKALRGVFGELVTPSMRPLDVVDLLAKNAEALDRFFLSISQGRRSRAGTAVETFFDTLFRDLGYPFEREHVVNGTPDFVFPNVLHFRRHPTDCIIFTSKRTLRERWRQITSEGSRGFVLFLATLDSSIKPADLAEINKQKINLVVPEHIRAEKYTSFPHVISIEIFLRDHLDPAMDRWRRNKIVV